ncbi:MAG: hypothetical protein OHK0012_14010 [Synechococcales cyanobacterium]
MSIGTRLKAIIIFYRDPKYVLKRYFDIVIAVVIEAGSGGHRSQFLQSIRRRYEPSSVVL